MKLACPFCREWLEEPLEGDPAVMCSCEHEFTVKHGMSSVLADPNRVIKIYIDGDPLDPATYAPIPGEE